MVICERCGAEDLLLSDLCGDTGCVYCYGTPLRKDEKCISCEKETEEKLFKEDLCPECYEKVNAMKFTDREDFIYNIFAKQVRAMRRTI